MPSAQSLQKRRASAREGKENKENSQLIPEDRKKRKIRGAFQKNNDGGFFILRN